jgi:hypothetical protein
VTHTHVWVYSLALFVYITPKKVRNTQNGVVTLCRGHSGGATLHGAAARARCRARTSFGHRLRVSSLLDAHRYTQVPERAVRLPPCHAYRTQACVASHNFSTMEAKEKSARTSDFKFNDMSYMHRVAHEHVTQARSLTRCPTVQQVRQRPCFSTPQV